MVSKSYHKFNIGSFLAQINDASWFHKWAIPLVIFVIAFLLRAIYPVSRPITWSDRAFHFGNAVIQQDWATTYQRYHPGVTLMWLSGTALQLFSKIQGGLTPDQMLGIAPTKPGILSQSVTAGVLPLAVVIAICIALTYPLLSRLAGRAIAFVAAILIALDPFFIDYSKVIHPDALLTSFMLISALALLVYLKETRHRWLIMSGVFGGLSLLSKTPAIYLILYTLLLVSVSSFYRIVMVEQEFGWPRLGRAIWETIRTMLLWGVIAGLVFVVLWPAMWVKPTAVLQQIYYRGIVHHSTDPHPNPVFFNGNIYTEDPGPAFYLATIIWKTTAITLPLILIGFIFAVVRIRSPRAKIFWALVTYVFFFIAQMALSEFKQMPYILPTFPALDILAAFGLVWSAEALSNLNLFRDRVWIPRLFVVFALAAQAILVLDHFPYFGTHFNNLLGGSRVAQNVLPLQDNGEGLDKAGRFLSQLPHGQDETAILFNRSAIVFQREFIGRTLTEIIPWASYRIYYINQLMRGLGEDAWAELWLQDQKSDPLLTIDFDGVTYVWVYGEIPEDPAKLGDQTEVDCQLGNHIQLTGYSLDKETLSPGESITVVFSWLSDGEVSRDYTVFTHLLSPDGELIAQQDNIPLFGIRPTTTWREAEELEDVYRLFIGEDIEPGQYELSVGMYDPESLQRLSAYNQDGDRLIDDRIIIGTITIE